MRRRAPPPRRRALSPPPSGPAAATPRGLRLKLLADGRLQRARFRRLRTPTRGICRLVTGVSVHRPAALRPAGYLTSFCTSPSLSTTSSSSTLNFYSKRQVICRILPEVYQNRLDSHRDPPHSHQVPPVVEHEKLPSRGNIQPGRYHSFRNQSRKPTG